MKRYKIMSVLLSLIVAAACAGSETKPVSFVVEPKTPEEEMVARRLETLVTAYNLRNIDSHVAHYAPDAKIESLVAGDVVSRDRYHAALRSLTQLPSIDLQRTRITILSLDRSRVEADLRSFYSGRVQIRRIVYEFVRRDGQWFIIEQQYPK